MEAKVLSLTAGIPANGQQIGEAETRTLIVFQYFSDASVIARRRQMHKTQVKLLRKEEKKSTSIYKCQTPGAFYFVVTEHDGE